MKQSIVKQSVKAVVHQGKGEMRLTDTALTKGVIVSRSTPSAETEAQRKRTEISTIIRSAALFINRLKQQL